MNFPWPKRIQWKLTLSYTLASVAVSIVILFLGGLVAAALVVLAPVWPLFMAMDSLTFAPQLRPMLEESPPAGTAISSWLLQLKAGIEDPQHQRLNGFSFSFGPENVEILLVVANAQGMVLGVAPEEAVPVGTSMEKALLPEERLLRDSALRGVTDPQMLSARLSDGAASAIVPILNKNGDVIALMMSRIRRPFVASELFQNTVRGLPIKILLVTPCAALFGLIFGAFVARGLTRRIERLSGAAHEWGRGNFAITSEEPTPDELGQLAKQLNKMAADVHELLVLRQHMAALDERHRLARELHDTVKQEIFAANMQISAARGLVDADPRTVELRLDEAQKLLRNAQRELTEALRELRPPQEQDSELAERIKEFVTNWGWQNNIAATFAGEDVSSVSPPVAHALFRIVQEALANVARHSGATLLKVELIQRSLEILELRISDNGGGFAVSKVSAGMGIRNMRERAEALPQGTFAIISKSGEGTRIEVTCAIAMAAATGDEQNVR